MLPSRSGKFWQLQPHPKKLVNQCCYLSPTTRAFIFFRRKTQRKWFKKMRSSFRIWGYVRHFFACLCARFRHFLRFPDVIYLQPTLFLRMWWHPIFPVYWCACVCLCAFVCAYLCAGKRKKKWRWRRFRRKRSFTRACRGGSYANNLYRIFVFVYLLLFTFFIPLSLILSSAFHMYLFTFYGSFCSIPRQLLLRRGFVTINLLVFLFTE